MRYRIQLIQIGRVARQGTCSADSQEQAEREVNQGVDVLAGDWVEVTRIPEDTPERAEVVREAVETIKHPENIGAG